MDFFFLGRDRLPKLISVKIESLNGITCIEEIEELAMNYHNKARGPDGFTLSYCICKMNPMFYVNYITIKPGKKRKEVHLHIVWISSFGKILFQFYIVKCELGHNIKCISSCEI